ncbi:MAG: hypothetical protein AMJ89_01465 [candidate division Zixibacteria bacterium SM23_73]|nr:MAG: hypothetical protein AMJ89_01465 [candidate division Zixibacteria bacterium SM23_73]
MKTVKLDLMNVALGLMLRKNGKRESVYTAEDLWIKILSTAPIVESLSKKNKGKSSVEKYSFY